MKKNVLKKIIFMLLISFIFAVNANANSNDSCGNGLYMKDGICVKYKETEICNCSVSNDSSCKDRGCVPTGNGLYTIPTLGTCNYKINLGDKERFLSIEIKGFLNDTNKYSKSSKVVFYTTKYNTTKDMEQILNKNADTDDIILTNDPYRYIVQFTGKYIEVGDKCASEYVKKEEYFKLFLNDLSIQYGKDKVVSCPTLAYLANSETLSGQLGLSFFTYKKPTDHNILNNCTIGYEFASPEFVQSDYFKNNGGKDLANNVKNKCSYNGYIPNTSKSYKIETYLYNNGKKTIKIDDGEEQLYEWDSVNGINITTKTDTYSIPQDIDFSSCQNYCVTRCMNDYCIVLSNNSLCNGSDKEPIIDMPIKTGCGMIGKELADKLRWFLDIVKYGGVLLAIGLGMLDFAKAVYADEADANKKASQKFVKRIIAAALIFILPLIIQFLLNIVEIDGVDRNSPFCIRLDD